MRVTILFTFTLASIAGAAAAAAQEMAHQHHSAAGIASIQPLYERVKDLYTRSAEQSPESFFAYRPTASVRTFAEMLGHVINEHYLFCASALGEDDPNTTDFEKTTSKAELTKALAASFAYCDRAYAMAESKAMEEASLFGQTGSRLWVLIFNVTHDSEHYGNIVTYMRMNGMVPPSSQGGM